jgi:hypothetical protein
MVTRVEGKRHIHEDYMHVLSPFKYKAVEAHKAFPVRYENNLHIKNKVIPVTDRGDP